jgi:hypothetical protein
LLAAAPSGKKYALQSIFVRGAVALLLKTALCKGIAKAHPVKALFAQ